MTQALERPRTAPYARPRLEPLGTLRSLTRGAGPQGEPVVMQTGFTMPYEPPAIAGLGTLRSLTRGAGQDGQLIVMQTGGGIPGGDPVAG